MSCNKHYTDHLCSVYRYAKEVNRLGYVEEQRDAMRPVFEKRKKKFRGTAGLSESSTGRDIGQMSRRNRKDLRNLYGMNEVPDEIYDMIMRADNGKVNEVESIVLEEYIEEKKLEIRKRKIELGIEGRGSSRSIGRLAQQSCLLFREPNKLYLEDEENNNE